jgi:hypothetical protein
MAAIKKEQLLMKFLNLKVGGLKGIFICFKEAVLCIILNENIRFERTQYQEILRNKACVTIQWHKPVRKGRNDSTSKLSCSTANFIEMSILQSDVSVRAGYELYNFSKKRLKYLFVDK